MFCDVEGVVNVKRAVLSVLFGSNVTTASIPNNSAFGSVVSLNHVNVPSYFLDRVNSSEMKRVLHIFLMKGNISSHCLRICRGHGSWVSLTFLSSYGGTTCSFCGRSCSGRAS